MKFYELAYSAQEAEIGSTYPQSQTARELVKVTDSRHLWTQEIGRLRDDIVLPQPVLHPDARLTDLISTTSTWRLILSGKLKSILEKYIYPESCQFLPMKIHHINKQYDYWMVNTIMFDMEVIDYQSSEIWVDGAGGTKLYKLNCLDQYDFQEKTGELVLPKRVSIKKAALTEKTDKQFIQLQYVYGTGYFVSEKLKREIDDTGCTGMKFVIAE